MRSRTAVIGFAVALALCLSGWASPSRAAYHELERVVLGGDGLWDLLAFDPQAHRLYIPRPGGCSR